MFADSTPNQRASRVAIAGSIYMRRASLEVTKPKQPQPTALITSIRKQSFGKIVRNGPKKNNDQIQDTLLNGYSRRLGTPLLDRKNLLACNLEGQYKRKTKTPSFGNFEDIQNSKIKAIQQKYRTMLSQYETKKKAVNSELNSLKSSTLLQKNPIFRQQIQLNIENRPTKNYVKQYEAKSKQLIVQKISNGAKQLNVKKKEKMADKYPKFFKGLRNQILLEQQLRGIKAFIHPDKKQQIQKILSENEQIKNQKLLQLDSQQFDPFQNRKPSQLSAAAQANKLIQKFQQCQTHWKQNICTLNISRAKQIFEALNFEKSKQITLKSFVRQISFLLQKHLRNRDLLKIYNRLTPLTQDNFCRIVTNNI